MNNRERLLNTCLYDFLVTLNESIMHEDYVCLMEHLQDKYIFDDEKYRCHYGNTWKNCDKCIQKWLNDKEKSR